MIAGIACIVIGILLNGKLSDFLDPSSVFITVGGTFSAILIGYPMNQIKDTFKSLKIAFDKKTYDPTASIEKIIELATIARRDGLLALENMLDDVESPFLKKGIMLVVDGSNSELVKNVMETEIYYISTRHERNISVLNAGGAYAPAFGMAGTLIGLIAMLVNLEDSSTLGSSMSIALVTTFYGSLLANLFFVPMSKKLKMLSSYEESLNEMMLEGILSIQDGENPRAIRSKLDSFISHEQSLQLDEKMKGNKKAE